MIDNYSVVGGLVDPYTLEKLGAKDEKKLFDIINNYLLSGKVNEAIKAVKLSKYIVHSLKEVDPNRIDSLKKIFSQYVKVRAVEAFFNEVYMLQQIAISFFAKLNRALDEIKALGCPIVAFIIFIEQFFKYNLEGVYQKVFELSDINRQNYIAWIDNLMILLKFPAFMIFKEIDHVGLNDVVNDACLSKMESWVLMVQEWEAFDHIVELWIYLDAFLIIEDNCVTVKVSNQKVYKNWMLSNFRYKTWRAHRDCLLGQQFERMNKDNKLPHKEQLNINEISGADFIEGVIYSNTLSEKFYNISIKEWLKGYAIIIDLANKRLALDVEKIYSLSNRVLHADRKWWLNLFNKNGLSKKKSEIIFNNLVFNFGNNKNIKADLIDKPIVKLGKQYILLSSIASKIHPGTSLISNMRLQNMNFKGKNFEKFILKQLAKSGITGRTINLNKSKREKHEVDIVFELNNELFIVECKCRIHPYSFKEHYAFDQEVNKYIDKFNIHCDFFKNHLYYINKKLNMPHTWKPKKVHQILLFSCQLGSYRYIDGCHVTDSYIFSQVLLGKLIRPGFPCFSVKECIDANDSKLASNTLIQGVVNSYAIKFKEHMCEHGEVVVRVGKFNTSFNIYIETEPSTMYVMP